jgi:cell division protein FtsW (lipid II flippase)
MTEVLTQRSAPVHPAVAGWVWFALMIGGWSAFFGLLLFSDSTLDELRQSLRDLPLVIEALVWLLLFPLVLATAVWESSWETWFRLALVCCFALVWSAIFFPRKRSRARGRARPAPAVKVDA